MNNLFKLFWIIGIAGLLFTSCQKDNIVDSDVDVDLPEVENVEINPLIARSGGGSGGGLDFDCFVIETPFGLVAEDGTVYEINEEDDIADIFMDEDSIIIVDFEYPLTIVFEDGEVETIEDGEDLSEAFAECVPGGGWDEDSFPAYLIDETNSCYTIEFPLDLQDTDGEITTVNNEDELTDAVASDIYFFVYPFTLIDEAGNTIVVGDTDSMFDALIACNGFEVEDSLFDWEVGFEYLGCYELAFPFDVVTGNGDVVTVENHMQFCDLMLEGGIQDYAYPLTLVDQEGEEITVNNEDELNDALEDCPDIWFFGPDAVLLLAGAEPYEVGAEACYDIIYPVTTLNEVGDVFTFDDQVSFIEALNNSSFGLFVEYPVTVILTSDNSEVELEDAEDIFEILADCQ